MTPLLLDTLSDEISGIAGRLAPAVVQLQARRWRPATGTVCGPDLVLVTAHSLGHDGSVRVRTDDGRTLDATLAGYDRATDLALLRVPGLDVTPPEVAPGLPRVGQVLLSLARSRMGALTASFGVASAIVGPLRFGRLPKLEKLIRTDLPVYPGGSGAPLLDAHGRVVGIVTTGLLRGFPLAVPAGVAWEVARGLAEHGTARVAYLGIGSQPVEIPEHQRGGEPVTAGLLILAVGDNTAAARAGLMVGDILIRFGGAAVSDPEELLALLTPDRIGHEVPAELLRAGQKQTVTVTVGERPPGR